MLQNAHTNIFYKMHTQTYFIGHSNLIICYETASYLTNRRIHKMHLDVRHVFFTTFSMSVDVYGDEWKKTNLTLSAGLYFFREYNAKLVYPC